MKFVRRADWGAPATSPAAYIGSTEGTKVHYLGYAYSSRSHSLCDDEVRKVRAMHLADPDEDWVDIAYNLVVCEHGYNFEGRGAHKRTGANGNQTLNTRDYAILALLGSSGMTHPTDEMLHGLRDGIEYLRSIGNAGNGIGCHKDGVATACPGPALTAWVRAGAPRPKEDDMPTANEIADAVLKRDGVIKNAGPDADENEYVALCTALHRIEALERRNEKHLMAIMAKLGI